MPRHLQLVACVLLTCMSATAQIDPDINTPTHRAWDILMNAVLSTRISDRASGTRALGLLRGNHFAREIAEDCLVDRSTDVRVAAATALGQMHASESIPKLEHALSDKRIPVVMAAAQSLRELKDDKAAYDVYYDLLSGERKTGDGLIAQQMQTLHDPKELAKIGFSEGIGFVPFAGIAWDAWRTMHKKDPSPVRAVAASLLAHDPDPSSAHALVKATDDKNWMVRAAALEALAQRGDPSFLPKVERKFDDKNNRVRYSAAAAVIRLTQIEESKTARNVR